MTNNHDSVTASVAFLRHTLATLAYRSAKVLRGAPEGFSDYRASDTSRTPLEILAHMGNLMEWALSMAQGTPRWNEAAPLGWGRECKRYFGALAELDRYLESGREIERRPERIFQAPIADALTHTGQLALLRRMAGSPVRGENYYVAAISTGQVGPDQPPPRMEFDG